MDTNLRNIREQTIGLLDSVPLMPLAGMEHTGAVNHPFTPSLFFRHPADGRWLNLSQPLSYEVFRQHIAAQVNSLSLPYIYDMVRDDFKLTWFRLVKDHMNEADFAYYLKHSWVDEEDPNQDRAVTLQEVVSYFRQANPEYLMNSEERAYYQSLPPNITIYRGVSPHRARLGLSWTADKDMALWFKKRYESGVKGQLLTADIRKEHVLTYIGERNEKELVVDVFSIRHQIREI